MRIDLYGGFGEKGRTSFGVRADRSLLFDAGIKVGAASRDYYPTIGPEEIRALDAVFISHAHEDHIGGLNWLLANGFAGTIHMTRETRDDAEAMLRQYAEAAHRTAFPLSAARIAIFRAGDTIALGGMRITSGRSGHVAGGVWFSVEAEGRRVVYCADVVPQSNVFVMDPIPACDLLAIDASYGADAVSAAERGRAIQQFIVAHAGGCLLPVPLSGKPLELMAILPAHFAIHASMRASLAGQIEVPDAVSPSMAEHLRRQLAGAIDWHEDAPFPDCPLLTHDGMGSAGPSVQALRRASEQDLPVLLTGHVPDNTPASAMVRTGQATWIRLPTHPTRDQNVRLWEKAGRPDLVGHSCGLKDLDELKPFMPRLRTGTVSGTHFEIQSVSSKSA